MAHPNTSLNMSAGTLYISKVAPHQYVVRERGEERFTWDTNDEIVSPILSYRDASIFLCNLRESQNV